MMGSVYCQTFDDWELIIVDDGSTEDIKSVVDSFKDERISYHRFESNRGIPHGINYAMEKASGEFISLLAADELLSETKLEDQVAFLDLNPDIDAIWGIPGNGPTGLRPLYEQNALRAHNRSPKAWVRTLLNLENVPIGGASMLCRKKVFEEIGYFDPQLTIFSDHEWFVRFFKPRKGFVLPYRWALSRPEIAPTSPRNQNQAVVHNELGYVRKRHVLETPSVEPTVTVGIAVKNMAHFIGDALDSVFAQTLQPVEIIILDDGSTDNIREVVSKYKDPRIQFFRFEESQGVMKANNYMMSIAKGTFYTPLAADDTIDKDYLKKVIHEFTQNPWLEFVSSQTDFMNETGKTLESPETPFQHGAMGIAKPINQPRERWLAQMYYGNVYFGVGTYRTETLRELGGWGTGFGVLGDYEMYLRLLQRENIYVIPENLTHTRLHEKNMSNLQNNKPGEGKNLQELYMLAKKDYYAPRMKVVIATPFYEMKGFSPYISSLANTIKLLTMLGIEHSFFELSGDSYVARARNTICTIFLEDPENTDLFFIDSDMKWDAEAFVRMLMLPEGVVAGSYPAKNMWETWTSFPIVKEEKGHVHPVGRPLQDGSALLTAETVATGFCRIKRYVLEQFRDHYKDYRYNEPGADQAHPDREYIEFFATKREDGLWWGEDRLFCKRLKEMGMDIFIYPNVNMGHYGVKGWSGNYDKFLRGQHGDSTGSHSKSV
jgi:glycosyltransferase involved in cell wall biosynthesis